jgi:hypothetical protein
MVIRSSTALTLRERAMAILLGINWRVTVFVTFECG